MQSHWAERIGTTVTDATPFHGCDVPIDAVSDQSGARPKRLLSLAKTAITTPWRVPIIVIVCPRRLIHEHALGGNSLGHVAFTRLRRQCILGPAPVDDVWSDDVGTGFRRG
jgi:hypothetical protein